MGKTFKDRRKFYDFEDSKLDRKNKRRGKELRKQKRRKDFIEKQLEEGILG